MAKLKTATIKKHLKSKSKEELEFEIVELHKKFSQVQEYYFSLLNPDDKTLLKRYKSIIEKEFNPFGKSILRYSIILKAIREFTSISTKTNDIAELLISTVELGVNFTRMYGDLDESFYNSNIKLYQQALQYIVENQLEELFYERASRLMEDSNNIGWGFDMAMTDIFYDYMSEFEEEEVLT